MGRQNRTSFTESLDIGAPLRLPSCARDSVMRSLRRLSAVSIALLSAILVLGSVSTPAQTASAPSAQPAALQNPVPFVAPVLPPLFPSGKASTSPLVESSPDLHVPPLSAGQIQRLQALNARDAQKLTLLSRNQGPCYTLRTYGFAPGQYPAEAPRLSSSTTCTPASGTHIRELVKIPSSH